VEGGDRRSAPLWLLPGWEEPLPAVHTRARFGLALVLCALALAAAAPAYLLLAPDSRWEPESLLVLLVILAFASYSAAAAVRGMVTLDASFIVALIALVFLGPVPAACVFALPEISAWLERRRIVSLLGNTAACLWGVLAAALTLELLTPGIPLDPGLADLPAVALAGVVLLTVSYLVTTLLVTVVWEGLKLRPLIEQEVTELAPACLVLLAVGTLTTLLYEELGPAGLAPLALLVLLPRALVPRLSQARDPAKLDRPAAISLYARAIAEGLDLDAAEKRVLLDAATHLGDAKRLTRIEDFERVMQTVLYCRERWDGKGGFPGVLSGDAIPVESRVLAVAEQLGSMTASGTRGLSPEQAIAALVARAGTEFDPKVVSAARWAIEQNVLVSPRTVAEPAPAIRAARRTSRPAGRTRSTQSS
jgi:HD domain